MKVKAQINTWLRWLQTRRIPMGRVSVVRVFDHDPRAFTQGLAYRNGQLFESTGTWENSSLRRVCTESGAVLESLPVENEFAEGLACLKDRIYQLTWTSGKVLIYSTDPLACVGQAQIDREGWGLAEYKGGLIATDGSNHIRRFDASFRMTADLTVRRLGLPFRHFNALTTARDHAFVNIWCTPLVAQIDLTSSRLVRMFDCSELEKIESPRTPHHILNGIAHVPERETFFATGKCWRNMMEVRLEAN